ncbi:hypothetical protein PQC39_gp006 [Vibrio phage Vp_R1]|uniref:Uncharacterized protein n=1 Tax=Vibrio phage Vp_R1 TaxID=2059867 RepID=A0A2H5BPW4_9CAUD|nr:hypothetical protein PQC39_gp006 [Vibrio phage Vp_R1]AUG88370.1 hypothetical protein VPR_006 [Vibrio phage Vp_R1]
MFGSVRYYYPEKGCWYCDGTVYFDFDDEYGGGMCSSCGEQYSYCEFKERGC